MELFFMMTAMLALLGPIALGRVRCIRIAPRLHRLIANCVPTVSRRDRATLSAGVFAGQLCCATLHIYATTALRRFRGDQRRNAGVRSSIKTLGWLTNSRSFNRNLPAA